MNACEAEPFRFGRFQPTSQGADPQDFSEWLLQGEEKGGVRARTATLNREVAQMFGAMAVFIATGILAVEVIEARHTCNQFPASHRD